MEEDMKGGCPGLL